MEKINFINQSTPALNATNLNKLQDNVENAIAEQINTQNTTSDSETYSCNYINGIVESGNNANGYYVKFIDGTIICYGTISNVSTEAGTGTNKTVTLPAILNNTNYNVSINIAGGTAYWAEINYCYSNKTTSTFSLNTWNNGVNDNNNLAFSYVVIGKWK